MDPGGGEKFDSVTKFSGNEQVQEFNAANALQYEVFKVDGGAEGESHEDGKFLRGINAVDIHGRVGFRIATLLCLEEDIFVGSLLFEHAAENEVTGAIQYGFD